MNIKLNKIDKFFELSNKAFDSDNESVYETLGFSKKDYLNEKLKMVKRLKLKSMAQLNKAKNESTLEKALQKIKQIIDLKNDTIKQTLENLILTRSPQFQFRNIEKLDESDLRELLSDLNLIDIIEELEKLKNAD